MHLGIGLNQGHLWTQVIICLCVSRHVKSITLLLLAESCLAGAAAAAIALSLSLLLCSPFMLCCYAAAFRSFNSHICMWHVSFAFSSSCVSLDRLSLSLSARVCVLFSAIDWLANQMILNNFTAFPKYSWKIRYISPSTYFYRNSTPISLVWKKKIKTMEEKRKRSLFFREIYTLSKKVCWCFSFFFVIAFGQSTAYLDFVCVCTKKDFFFVQIPILVWAI